MKDLIETMLEYIGDRALNECIQLDELATLAQEIECCLQDDWTADEVAEVFPAQVAELRGEPCNC